MVFRVPVAREKRNKRERKKQNKPPRWERGGWGSLAHLSDFICACTQISTQKFCYMKRMPYLCGNLIQTNMQIVSTREFRANQKKYFELAESESVFVSRKNARPILITVADDDDILTRAELQSIQRGLDDVKNGRTFRMEEGESLTDFLNRTEQCI